MPGDVLILDNASFHKSAKSRELVEGSGCQLMYLRPYSPDLNPIEKSWSTMKRRIREVLPKVSDLSKALDQVVISM